MLNRYAKLLALTTIACLPLMTGASAQEKPLKKVVIAMGSSVINIGYPAHTTAQYMGYWKQEGYDVELVTAGGSLQAIQQLVGGNAQFAQGNSTPVIQGVVTHNLPLKIAMMNTVIDWAIGVPEGSPIKEAKDFKGKQIGIFSLATGNLALLRSYLAHAGLKEGDYELVSIGFGPPAEQAIKSGRVDAVFFWGSGIAAFQNTVKLRRLYGEDWKTYPDYALAVLQSTADKDPQMVIGIARGMAKATAFSLENPECVRKLYWKHNPPSLPPGVTMEVQGQRDMNILMAQLETIDDAFKLTGSKVIGKTDVGDYDRLQKFLAETKQIGRTVPSQHFLGFSTDISKEINNFDVEAVRQSARSCTLPG